MAVELYQEFSFDAAHRFPDAPQDEQRGLHGHSFTARIVLRGEVDARTGFLADLAQVEARCQALRRELDHRYLNDVAGLENPSLERIAQWIWRRLNPDLPALARVEVRRDSQRHGCIYEGPTA
jgi:6-pyruvoyltetrahydropterin/6-carboxytetrahydropterin synthase